MVCHESRRGRGRKEDGDHARGAAPGADSQSSRRNVFDVPTILIPCGPMTMGARDETTAASSKDGISCFHDGRSATNLVGLKHTSGRIPSAAEPDGVRWS